MGLLAGLRAAVGRRGGVYPAGIEVIERDFSLGCDDDEDASGRKRLEADSCPAQEQKRPRVHGPIAEVAKASAASASTASTRLPVAAASSCSESESEAESEADSDGEAWALEEPAAPLKPGLAGGLRRSGSWSDLLVSESEVEGQFLRWREDLTDLTGHPEEVLDELLVAHVREHGWDTGEHLCQILVSAQESTGASEACARAFACAHLARPAEAGPEASQAATICVVCREAGGDMMTVSAVCGHSLHRACLREGLQVQLREGAQASSFRCPACTGQRAAPVPLRVAAEALGEESLALGGLERERWLQAGSGSLFRACPSGACRIRPGSSNYSMQVACSCSARHRFCLYCGQSPHEPVPCAQMMEVRSFVDGLCQELREVRAEQRGGDLGGATEADRAALLLDLEEAHRMASSSRAPASTDAAVLDGDAFSREDYDYLLGARPHGALRASAEVALTLLRGWPLHAAATPPHGVSDQHPAGATDHATVVPSVSSQNARSSEELMESRTRPCPRCFIPIEKEGGCQHMTCTNPQCRHEFCWLCLQDWRHPSHNGMDCALRRLEGFGSERVVGSVAAPAGEATGIMASMESRILENWQRQPEATRPTSMEDYATEVRRRFQVALATDMRSDRELLASLMPEGGPILHLSLPLLHYYEVRERRAREAASVVFRSAMAEPHRRAAAAAELRNFTEWAQARWWLRLMPEDAEGLLVQEDEDEEEEAEPRGSALITTGSALGSSLAASRCSGEQAHPAATRLRAEHAVHRLRVREASRKQERVCAVAAGRFLALFGSSGAGVAMVGQEEVLRLLMPLVEAVQQEEAEAEIAKASAAARALALGSAACIAWRAGQLLELVGALRPAAGHEARCLAMATDRWTGEVEARAAALRSLFSLRGSSGDSSNSSEERLPAGEMEVLDATEHLNVARRAVFQFALEYCGGTRRTVRRRGE